MAEPQVLSANICFWNVVRNVVVGYCEEPLAAHQIPTMAYVQVLDGRRITERGGGRHAASVPGSRVQAGAGASRAPADAAPAPEAAGKGLGPGPRPKERRRPVRASAAAVEAGGGRKRGAEHNADAEGAQPRRKKTGLAHQGVMQEGSPLGHLSLKPGAGREGLLGAIKPLPPPAAMEDVGAAKASAKQGGPGAQPAAGSSTPAAQPPAAAPAGREARADALARPWWPYLRCAIRRPRRCSQPLAGSARAAARWPSAAARATECGSLERVRAPPRRRARRPSAGAGAARRGRPRRARAPGAARWRPARRWRRCCSAAWRRRWARAPGPAGRPAGGGMYGSWPDVASELVQASALTPGWYTIE